MSEGSCPKVSAADAVELDGAITKLKEWRTAFPSVKQLNGEKGNDPTPWYHIRIRGYTSPEHDYTAKHTGVTFKGTDYNGVVNFHGDAKSTKIDEMIRLYEDADGRVQDVFVPSATYEFEKSVPIGKTQKPRFALRGYNEVDGFFLYHDQWPDSNRED